MVWTHLSSLALLASLLCSAGPLPELDGGPPEAEVPQLPEGAVCAVQGHALGPLPWSSCDINSRGFRALDKRGPGGVGVGGAGATARSSWAGTQEAFQTSTSTLSDHRQHPGKLLKQV